MITTKNFVAVFVFVEFILTLLKCLNDRKLTAVKPYKMAAVKPFGSRGSLGGDTLIVFHVIIIINFHNKNYLHALMFFNLKQILAVGFSYQNV